MIPISLTRGCPPSHLSLTVRLNAEILVKVEQPSFEREFSFGASSSNEGEGLKYHSQLKMGDDFNHFTAAHFGFYVNINSILETSLFLSSYYISKSDFFYPSTFQQIKFEFELWAPYDVSATISRKLFFININ
jgi:hypothetical protein